MKKIVIVTAIRVMATAIVLYFIQKETGWWTFSGLTFYAISAELKSIESMLKKDIQNMRDQMI